MERILPTMASYERGEIWLVNLNPAQGDEMSKVRPCVVLSGRTAGRLNLRIIAPITDWKEHYAGYFWMTRLDPDETNGLKKVSTVDSFQVRCISFDRFVSFVGNTIEERLDRIVKASALCMR
jgi:mRNA interferase MazF